MSETNMNAYVNGISDFLRNYVLSPIGQHLASKGIHIPQEELAAVLQLPAIRPTTMTLPNVAMPSMSFGGVVPSAAPKAAASRKVTSTTATPIAGQTCSYQFKRGINKGEYCVKPAAPGSIYCSGCLKQRIKGKAGAGEPSPGITPGVAPGLNGLPAAYAAEAASNSKTLNAEVYDQARELYKEITHNFILKAAGGDVFVVIGKLSDVDGKIVPLNEDDKENALAMDLQLPSETTVAPITMAQPVTRAANIPSMPTMQIPAGLPTMPQIPGIPAMPSFPSLPPNLPQIPGIPSVQPGAR